MRINSIENVTKEMLKGKIIAFPTDTVYGVGALIDDEVAIEKIYTLKKYNKILKEKITSENEIEEVLKRINGGK